MDMQGLHAMSDDDSEATTGRDVTGDLTEPAAAARERFLVAVEAVRPRLHRFLARMTGSVFDGEDLLQDTLADAFFKLGGLRDERTLEHGAPDAESAEACEHLAARPARGTELHGEILPSGQDTARPEIREVVR